MSPLSSNKYGPNIIHSFISTLILIGSNYVLNVTTCSFYIFTKSELEGNAFSTLGICLFYSTISSSFLSNINCYYGANDITIYSPLEDSKTIYLDGSFGGSTKGSILSSSGASNEIVSS